MRARTCEEIKASPPSPHTPPLSPRRICVAGCKLKMPLRQTPHLPAPRPFSLLPRGPASRPRGSDRCPRCAGLTLAPDRRRGDSGLPLSSLPPPPPPPPPRRLLPPDPSCKQHPGSIYSRRRTARDPRQLPGSRRGWGKSECATFTHTRPAPPRHCPARGPERDTGGLPAPSFNLRRS